jgi:general secretion pathway protein K
MREDFEEHGRIERSAEGFALIVVLWGMVVIGLLIAHLTAAGRTETKIAGNMEAAAAADGGVAAAIFYLSQTDDRLRWAVDGVVHTIKIGSAAVSVRCWNEAGKINPNRASDALMSALLQETGVPPSRAETLAAAIGGWHDPVRQARPGGGGPGDYSAAGLDYGPPGSPIEDVGELSRVLGMTPNLAAALRPHLSLWNQSEFPVMTYSDVVVRRAVEQMAKTVGMTAQQPVQATSLTVSIVATGRMPSGASFSRRAIVEIGPGLEKGYRTLAWDRDLEE